MAIYIDPKSVRAEFKYNPDTGELTRDVSIWEARQGFKGAKSEKPYAHKSGTGKTYLRIGFSGKYIYAHRIIWVLMTGEQPQHIDHIDGNGLNNKWDNLRSVTQAENNRNARKHTQTKSNMTGVTFRKDNGRWRVRICVNNRVSTIGTFKNLDDAVAAREAAYQSHGYAINHGKIQRPAT
jgi:hypothetical protein